MVPYFLYWCPISLELNKLWASMPDRAGQRLWGRDLWVQSTCSVPHKMAGIHRNSFSSQLSHIIYSFFLILGMLSPFLPSSYMSVIPRVFRAHCIYLTGIINFVVFRLWNTKQILAPFRDYLVWKELQNHICLKSLFAFHGLLPPMNRD